MLQRNQLNDVVKSPYPYAGGKSTVAGDVWARFGDVRNYVEPFFGSGAVLLADSYDVSVRTINDKDGFITNVWRAIQADPDSVAHYADRPVNETDLIAIHVWLVERREWLTANLERDPDWFDSKCAGWWIWGACCWIGSGWCSGKGPWSFWRFCA